MDEITKQMDKMTKLMLLMSVFVLLLVAVGDWLNSAVCSFEAQGQVAPSFTGNMSFENGTVTSMSLGKTELDLKGQVFCRDISSALILSRLK